MLTNRKKFALTSKFESYYSSKYPIFFNGDQIILGKDANGSLEINILNAETFEYIKSVEASSETFTSFIASDTEPVMYVSTSDNIVKKYCIDTNKFVKTWKSTHNRPIYKMSLNSLNNRLVSGASDGSVRIFHIGPSESIIKSCNLHQSVITNMEICRNKLFVASLSEFFVSVWNIEEGELIGKIKHQNPITGIAFCAYNPVVATCSHDKTISLWDINSLEKLGLIPTYENLDTLKFLPVGSLENHLKENHCTVEAPILACGGQSGLINIWRLERPSLDGQFQFKFVLKIQGPKDRCRIVTESEKGNIDSQYDLYSIKSFKAHQNSFILIRNSDHVEFYDISTFKLTKEFLGDIGQIQKLVVVNNSRETIEDQKTFIVIADSTPHLKIFTQPPHLSQPEITLESQEVEREKLFEPKCKSSWFCKLVPSQHNDIITDLVQSPDGKLLATCAKDSSLSIWQANTENNVILSLLAHKPKAHSAHISSICFFKTACLLISVCEEKTAILWNMNLSGEEFKLEKSSVKMNIHDAIVNSIDVSSADTFIATGSRDKSIKIWKLSQNQTEIIEHGTLRGHSKTIWSVRFMPNSSNIFCSASSDREIRIWNAAKLTVLDTLQGHSHPVLCADWFESSPQSSVIISSDQSGIVRLWRVGFDSKKISINSNKDDHKRIMDPNMTEKLNSIDCHEGRITTLGVVPDSRGFYSAGEDCSICYFSDITELSMMNELDREEELIKNIQELSNLRHEGFYDKALLLALRLNHPRQALELISDIIYKDKSVLDNCLANMVKVLKSDPKLVSNLLQMVNNWNTRVRTSTIAQTLFNWLIKHCLSYDQIKDQPDIQKFISGFLAYSKRHLERVQNLSEQMKIVEFLVNVESNQSAEMDLDISQTDLMSTSVISKKCGLKISYEE